MTGFRQQGIAQLLRWGSRWLSRSGHSSLVSQLFKTADELAPQDIPAYSQAFALWQEGNQAEARNLLERILAAQPAHAEANNLLGACLLNEGDEEGARGYFYRALVTRPEFAAPHNNLGNIHLAEGNLDAAANCYHAALRYKPGYVEALTNLGSVHNLQGDNQTAEHYCREAVVLAPEFAGAHCNLGNVLLSLGRIGEAIVSYQEALRLRPGLPQALINLALSLQDVGFLPGAIEYYEKQSERHPNDFLPHVRIAQALQVLGHWDAAAHRLQRALELKPDSIDTLAVLSANYMYIGDARTGMDYLQQVLDAIPRNALSQSRLIFDRLYLDGCTGEEIYQGFRDWAECYATRPLLPSPPKADAVPERRLRIGFVSLDFCKHPVYYFLVPILQQLDRAQFEVYCYSALIQEDGYTECYRKLADHWRDISTLSEQATVDMVCEDNIDILVDLSGHTTGNRLGVFGSKPAPVQVNYLGHPATTGLTTMDYRLVDAITDPAALVAGHYSETLYHLPGCFLTYQPADDAPPVQPAPFSGNGYITFGSFNNLAKVNDKVIALWARVLHEVPNSRLMLKSFALSSERGRKRIVEGFAVQGITLERLELVEWSAETQHHLELYNKIDIALDTFPYNGTTTTCEALWMGVPVISLAGEHHAARVGASLLTVLGLDELLAQDTHGFVQIASRLAADTARLNAITTGMRERMMASPLLDHAGFTRHLENAFREMWRTYCARRQNEVEAQSGDKPIALDLAGVAKICLPDSYEVMSRYVIEEQGDWFEDEIRFVRLLLGAGQSAIDVGANYGVYTLSMAALVGPSGKLYSFEPDSSTAGLLHESLALNSFAQVQVIERAVSDSKRRGFFRLEHNSELNRLLDADEAQDADGGVDVTTLDDCRAEFGWESIDFVKIDAEGQEPQVVRGAPKFFGKTSPLVMAEYKHAMEINHALIEEFECIGYKTWRLVPGLMVLTPVADVALLDDYQLNLFFCKEDKAQALSARGLLTLHGAADGVIDSVGRWSQYIADKDYTKGWPVMAGMDEDYLHGLNCFALSTDTALPAAKRLAALEASLVVVQQAISANSSLPRRLTLARIQAELGMRVQACAEYTAILKSLDKNAPLSDEHFLAPSTDFERIACVGELNEWMVAAVCAWLARHEGFSSYFVTNSSLRNWQRVRATGYCEAEAQRNIDLILRHVRGVNNASSAPV
jgi:FkbM family methyltransferase